MNTGHLTEKEMQEFASGEHQSNTELALHVNSCVLCREKISEYAVIFSALREQPRPVPAFDLSALVVPELPVAKKQSRDNALLYFLAGLGLTIAAIVWYVFREYAASLFSNITPFLLSLLMTAVVTLSAWLVADMYKRFKKKIDHVDLYHV